MKAFIGALVNIFVRIGFTAQMALHGVTANPLRSGLTLLGVAIGVTSVITLMGIGEGARQTVVEQFKSLGSNVIIVKAEVPTHEFAPEKANELLDRVDSLAYATPVIHEEFIMRWRRARGPADVLGVNEQFPNVRDHELIDGSFFNSLHVKNRATVAVLGYNVAKGLLNGRSPVGYTITIEGVTFNIIGVLAPKGAGKGEDIDDKIVLPYSTVHQLAKKRTVPEIWAKARSAEEVDLALAHLGRIIKRELGEGSFAPSRPGSGSQGVEGMSLDPGVGMSPGGDMGDVVSPGQEEERGPTARDLILSQRDRITITSLNQMVDEADKANRVMTLLLGGIAAVSLLVGGLGIMNIMLVSVNERTAEIGVRRALGATQWDLLLQFLLEAVYLSGLGAVAGVVAGLWASQLFAEQGLQTSVNAQAIFVATMVALGSGVMFGVYPAMTASSLAPVEALRRG